MDTEVRSPTLGLGVVQESPWVMPNHALVLFKSVGEPNPRFILTDILERI